MASNNFLKAAREGNVEFLKYSVEILKRPDEFYVELRNEEGFNILHIAAANHQLDYIQKAFDTLRPETIRTLLQQRAKNGKNPLHAAVEHNYIEVLRLFLNFYQVQFPPPEDRPWLAMDNNGDSLLGFACKMHHQECALEIWKKESVMDIELLVYSIKHKHNILAVGMLSGFSLENNNNRNNGVKAQEFYLFHNAAAENNSEFIRDAIKVLPPETTQILMEQCNKYGINPFHGAAAFGNDDILRHFLDFYRGRELPPPNRRPWLAKNEDGTTPLGFALEFGKEECVSLLSTMNQEVGSDSDLISSVNQIRINDA